MIAKKAKQYPPPFGSAPVAMGNKKEILPFTIQLDNEPMDIPCERILLGNISHNKTHETAPIEEAKRATKETNAINKTHAGKPVLK